jgi:CHASE3 domain sensor protein
LNRINHRELEERELLEQWKTAAELAEGHVKLLERLNAEKAKAKKIEVLEKKNEVLEKKYEDVLDLNRKEYDEAQQEVRENLDAHHKCLDHYLDLFRVYHTPD